MEKMIFDRSYNDVVAANNLIRLKVKKFIQLSGTEIETLERGTLTINTLNRIENAISELRILFNDMGYWNTPIETKQWSHEGIFTEDDFNIILNNIDVLRNAFFVFSNTPTTPNPKYNYSNINDMERILADLDIMSRNIKNLYRECGAFECGQEG